MTVMRPLRERLGAIKSLIVDDWPYRRRMATVPRMREEYRRLLGRLPALPPLQESRFELHMLCGHRDSDMGIWASWSIMRFFTGNARLYVHSDGTLTQEDESLWHSVVGQRGEVVVVRRQDSDSKIGDALASRTPYLYSWRRDNWAGTKLTDVHFFGSSQMLLLLDSDTLTFSRPGEVIDALSASTSRFTWASDTRDAYSACPEILKDVTGVAVPKGLCSGFLVCPRVSPQELMILEEHIKKLINDPRTPVNHWWSEQTYYALLANRYASSSPLSEAYSNSLGTTAPEQIMRHYVGIPKVRFRYFTEGLPRIIEQIGLRLGQ